MLAEISGILGIIYYRYFFFGYFRLFFLALGIQSSLVGSVGIAEKGFILLWESRILVGSHRTTFYPNRDVLRHFRHILADWGCLIHFLMRIQSAKFGAERHP